MNREMLTEIARGVVKDIGYDQDGFSWHGADVEVLLHGQSPDIAMGVNAKKKKGGEEEGAGDQGMMFGYACTESEVYEKGSFMPAPIYLRAQDPRGALRAAPLRASCSTCSPTPRARSRVQYVDGKPVGCTKVVVSTQHNAAEPQRQEIHARHGARADRATRSSPSLPKGWMPKKAVRLPGQPDRQFRGRRP